MHTQHRIMASRDRTKHLLRGSAIGGGKIGCHPMPFNAITRTHVHVYAYHTFWHAQPAPVHSTTGIIIYLVSFGHAQL